MFWDGMQEGVLSLTKGNKKKVLLFLEEETSILVHSVVDQPSNDLFFGCWTKVGYTKAVSFYTIDELNEVIGSILSCDDLTNGQSNRIAMTISIVNWNCKAWKIVFFRLFGGCEGHVNVEHRLQEELLEFLIATVEGIKCLL